jgi:hypothetical protein
VVASLTQRVGELLVLADSLLKLPLGLQQPLLEGANPLGSLLEAPPKGRHLFLEGCSLLSEVVQFGVAARVPDRFVIAHDKPSLHLFRCGSPHWDATPGSDRFGAPLGLTFAPEGDHHTTLTLRITSNRSV